MNDRVSKKPPVPYLGPEDELGILRGRREYRDSNLAQQENFTQHSNDSIAGASAAERSETSRHSSIFRFGKSIAASFNPTNWKIWSKQHPVPDEEETEQLRSLREQKEKAEKIYRELKESGRFRESTIGFQNYKIPSELKDLATKHDSGVEFNGNGPAGTEMSMEDKRRGRVFLDPPKFARRDASPASSFSGSIAPSNASPPHRRSSFRFKKASLPNFKKEVASDNGSIASDNGDHCARRVPSRKDLRKQQKLSKRVSDLESKLEAARRQLYEASGEPAPSNAPSNPAPRVGRSRFVPGALATLPSERLLSGYVEPEAGYTDIEGYSEVDKTFYENMKQGQHVASGIRFSEEQSDGGYHEEVSPTLVGKPSPPRPRRFSSLENRALPSVEKDIAGKEESVAATGAAMMFSEPATWPDDSNNTNLQEEEPEASEFRPQPVKLATKKRKSSFERLADDGGVYKPGPETESDAESQFKKSTSRKKGGPRPRKLRRVAQEPATDSPSKATSNRDSIMSYTTGRSSRLPKANMAQKSNINKRKSVSPPPSTTFTGLEYIKPSTTRRNATPPHPSPDRNMRNTADPSNEDFIPPVPKLPEAVLLPNGEVVSTSSASAAAPLKKAESVGSTSGGAKLRKKTVEGRTVRSKFPQKMKGGETGNGNGFEKEVQAKKSWDGWDEDVF